MAKNKNKDGDEPQDNSRGKQKELTNLANAKADFRRFKANRAAFNRPIQSNKIGC